MIIITILNTIAAASLIIFAVVNACFTGRYAQQAIKRRFQDYYPPSLEFIIEKRRFDKEAFWIITIFGYVAAMLIYYTYFKK